MKIKIENADALELYDSLIDIASYSITTSILTNVEKELRKTLEELSPDVYNLYEQKRREVAVITKENIKEIVHNYFGKSFGQVDKKTRKRELVQVRHYTLVFSRKYTEDGLATIGSLYNYGCDHSTVLHAIKTLNNLKDTEAKTRKHIESINKIIQTNYPNAVEVNKVF